MTLHWPITIQILISAIRSVVIALVLFSLGLLQSHAANTAQLKGFQLEQVLSGTRVVLMTNQPITYRLQESSDQKIVLEVDNVQSSGRLNTQLNQSRNVHHVAIKNLPGESLRLTIYGEKLGHPFVSFKTPEAPYTVGNSVLPVANSSVTANPKTAPSLSKFNKASIQQEEEAFALPAIAELEADNTEATEVMDMTTVAEKDPASTPQGVGLPERPSFQTGPIEVASENTEAEDFSLLNWALDFLIHIQLKDVFILAAVSGFVLVGLWFAIRLLQNKQPEDNGYQNTQTPQQPSFISKTLNAIKHLFVAPKPVPKSKRSFKQIAAAQQQLQASGPQQGSPTTGPQPSNPQVNQLLSKNQANRAYGGQSQLGIPPRKKSFQDQELERELKRSLEMKYRMGGYNANRDTQGKPKLQQPNFSQQAKQAPRQQQQAPRQPQQASKNYPNVQNGNRISPNNVQTPKPSNPKINNTGNRPTIAQGQDIPENKEVLDFLRNVADLMEKDGKPNLAQDIKRAISDK